MSPTIRFVHSAGFRFDSRCWEGPVSWVAMRNQELWQSFEAMLRLCRTEKADFLFLTGNMFDQEYVCKETVERVAKSLTRLKKISVFITPGEMDPLVTTSAYRLVEWPDNVHIFPGGVNQIDIPSLGVTIYGAGWTTYRQQKGFLDDFRITEKAGQIQFMLLHAEVESAHNTEGFIPVTEEQIAASGLTYLALGHKENWSGIQQAGDTYWADCGFAEAKSFRQSGPHGVLLGETDGRTTQIKFVEMGKRLNIETSLESHNMENMVGVNPALKTEVETSDQGYPALPQVFVSEVQRRLTHVDSTKEQRFWELVRKIGMSALGQGQEKKPSQQNSIVWPETEEEDFVHRVHNLRESGDEDFCLAKVRDSLARAKMKVQGQEETMEQVKVEYQTLRRNWEAENRRQEEQRSLEIEIKKLQAKIKHLGEKITTTEDTHKRLAFLHQNPDYRELRQMQGELPRLKECCEKTANELAEHARNPKVDWVMIEGMREECLEWAYLLEEKGNLTEEIQKLVQGIIEIEYELQVSGYEGLPDNEDERLGMMEAERKLGQEELGKLSTIEDEIIRTEHTYHEENIKLQNYELLAGITAIDQRKITQIAQLLEKWRSSRVSAYFDRAINDKLGLSNIEAKLTARLSRHCQKYQVTDYQDFLCLQQEYQTQQQVVASLQTKLEHLYKETKRMKSLYTIIDSHSLVLKRAFRIVDALDFSEWLNGWENYQRKKSMLAEMQNTLYHKREQQELKEQELSKFANQLRNKIQSRISPGANIDEVLEVVMKTARKLRAKEEAEKELTNLKQKYHTQLGKRNMDQMTKLLEPLADLEREECFSYQERQKELSAYLQEYAEVDNQLASAQNSVQDYRTTALKPDLEKKLEAVKLRLKTYEELQQALDDAHNLMEASRQKWQIQYGKALETQAHSINAHTFSSLALIKVDSVSSKAKQDYFVYRMALAELTLKDNPNIPLYFFVGEMKESGDFWEEVLRYLYELSISRQVIFDTTDDRLRGLVQKILQPVN